MEEPASRHGGGRLDAPDGAVAERLVLIDVGNRKSLSRRRVTRASAVSACIRRGGRGAPTVASAAQPRGGSRPPGSAHRAPRAGAPAYVDWRRARSGSRYITTTSASRTGAVSGSAVWTSGRGFAGPLVAAAVVLPRGFRHRGCGFQELTAHQREVWQRGPPRASPVRSQRSARRHQPARPRLANVEVFRRWSPRSWRTATAATAGSDRCRPSCPLLVGATTGAIDLSGVDRCQVHRDA